MSNPSAGFGFMPLRRLDGAVWNDALTSRNIASGYGTKIYRGDVVATTTDGSLIAATAGAGNLITGVFFGCEYFDTGQNRYLFMPFWSAPSTAVGIVRAYVVEDPLVEFQVRVLNSTAAPPTNIHQGTGIDLYSPSNTSTVGLSNQGADYTTIGTGATKQFKITGFLSAVSSKTDGTEPNVSTDPTAANPIIRVVLNQWALANASAGV